MNTLWEVREVDRIDCHGHRHLWQVGHSKNGPWEILHEGDNESVARLLASGPDLLTSLEDANNLLIGAAAWLEKSERTDIGKGLRQWVREKSEPVIAKANGE